MSPSKLSKLLKLVKFGGKTPRNLSPDHVDEVRDVLRASTGKIRLIPRPRNAKERAAIKELVERTRRRESQEDVEIAALDSMARSGSGDAGLLDRKEEEIRGIKPREKKRGPTERQILARLLASEQAGTEPWVPKVKGKREGTFRNEVGDWEKVKARNFSDDWPDGVNPLRRVAGHLDLSMQEVDELLRGGGFTQYRTGGVQELTRAGVRLNAFFADREIPASWKNPVLEALARSGNLDNLKLSQANKKMPGLASYITWSYRGNEKQSLEMRGFDDRAGRIQGQPPKSLGLLDPRRMKKMETRQEVADAYQAKTKERQSTKVVPERGPVRLTKADPTLGQMYWTGRARANELKGFDPTQMQDTAIYGSKSQISRKAEEIDWQEREADSVKEETKRQKKMTGRADVEDLDRRLEERGEGQYNKALLRVERRSEGTQKVFNIREQRQVEAQRRKGPERTEVQGSPEFLQMLYAYKQPQKLSPPKTTKAKDTKGTKKTNVFAALPKKGKATRTAKPDPNKEWDPSRPILGELQRAAAKGDLRAREILEQVGGADQTARDRQMGAVQGSAMMEQEDRELLQLLGLI